MREIIVNINKDGSEVRLEGKGFKGSGCLKKIEDALRNLGGEAEINRTADYYDREVERVRS
jgi:hypothetical protein